MNTTKLVGKTVYVKETSSISTEWRGEWGIVTALIGDEYHVAMWGDKNTQLPFLRNEFTVAK